MEKEIIEGLKEILKEKGISKNIQAESGYDGIKLEVDGENVKISYGKKNEFFRGVGLLLKNLKRNKYAVEEKCAFDTLTFMADDSRNAVMTVDANKELIRKLALMGYTHFMLYTEDTYEVNNNPLFGHKRGRYSKAEIKEIVAYAELFGIEVFPCIQTLAHLNGIAIYNTYDKFIDIKDILLVGDENTYKLIDDMFATLRECFKSKLIHIGMDEAEFVGRGKYLSKHGYKDSLDIIHEHLDKVVEIAKKYDFKPMMWSDMFFKIKDGGEPYYYDNEFRPEMKKSVPKDITLVYWDYYGGEEVHYDKIIKKHLNFDNKVFFAGGAWSWNGFAPQNNNSIQNLKGAITSCVKNKLKDFILTSWGDDGAECPVNSVLPVLLYTAERAYGHSSLKNLNRTSRAFFGVDYNTFLLLDIPNQLRGQKIVSCNPNKYLFYNDYFNGVMDATVIEGDGAHYKNAVKVLKNAERKSGEYKYLFSTMRALCEVLADKAEIGLKTRKAYLAGDKEGLKSLIKNEYSHIYKNMRSFYELYRKQWYKINKTQGFDVQDIRIGGMIKRTENCIKTLKEYLNGKIESIPEIAEASYDYYENLGDYERIPLLVNNWKRTFSCNVM